MFQWRFAQMIFIQYFAGLWLVVPLDLAGSIINLTVLTSAPSEWLLLRFFFPPLEFEGFFSFFLVFCNISSDKALLRFSTLSQNAKLRHFS